MGDTERAAYWLDESARRGPDEFRALFGHAFLYRALGEEEKAVAIAHRLQAMVPGNNASLVALVSFGRDREAIEMGETDWPALTCQGEPGVNRNNLFQAINLSLAYERSGRDDCSRALLEAMLAIIEDPATDPRAFGFLHAEVYARLGNMQRALEILRASVDSGMRVQWMGQVELSPHMEKLREVPEFSAIQDVVRADLARQLALVREMEARGELAPVRTWGQ